MPKKGKKGGKKGKKGKKGGKKTKKDLSVKAMSENNSKLWQTRLEVVEQSRQEYRENSRKLMVENETLSMQMQQTEKDTIDVVTYLKRQDQEKDRQIEKVIQQMKDQKKETRKEMENIIDDFQQQVSELEQKLAQKNHEVEIMQSELKQIKEFRRKRAHMQKELEEIKEAMFAANKEHKDTLTRMEQKFFEEKMRLQQEANQKIAELADKAHSEAISNLDETTRSVYKENVRVNEALTYHLEEGEKLKKIKEKLENQNEDLLQENEMNALIIREKVSQAKHHKETIKELQAKVESLETSLSHVVKEFEVEKGDTEGRHLVENKSALVEITKLQRTVDLKTREMVKVKRLAKNILDQRTEMERFFLDALEHVKNQITSNRAQYRKDAHAAYQQKMLAAHTGFGDFPKIRTFHRSDHSTNSVFRDLEAAERLAASAGKIDISELTWEQKEKVLRHLFARMNGTSRERANGGSRSAQAALPSSEQHMLTEREAWTEDAADHSDSQTFLTQAPVDGSSVQPGSLPQINHSSSMVLEQSVS